MRGEFTGVWSETWREIWQPLAEVDDPTGREAMKKVPDGHLATDESRDAFEPASGLRGPRRSKRPSTLDDWPGRLRVGLQP